VSARAPIRPVGQSQRGFTLIELLVAMVAGSFLLASLSWTLMSLGRELTVSRMSQSRQELAAVAPIVAGLIDQAMPRGRDEPPIITEPRRLVFITAPPAALGAVGPIRATLTVQSDVQGESLHARFEPVDPVMRFPQEARAERVLIRHYRQIRFDYRMATDKESGLPPRLVTISLVDREGRPARFAATPRLTTSGDCRFDPISMTCRR
jgi:prepilin-type N-terminal cleavage/methylation domain-containing protein